MCNTECLPGSFIIQEIWPHNLMSDVVSPRRHCDRLTGKLRGTTNLLNYENVRAVKTGWGGCRPERVKRALTGSDASID